MKEIIITASGKLVTLFKLRQLKIHKKPLWKVLAQFQCLLDKCS